MKALAEYEHKGYVFKKCKNAIYDYDCVIIMMKPENIKCNELRHGIVDKNFAKFRCNGLITVAIYDLHRKKFINVLGHCGIKYICYEVGKLAKPDKYKENISLIYASGIHYFLSLEAALGYKDGIIQYVQDGERNVYNANGRKISFLPSF
jgi:hypothetical protein